jgi:transposase-like protein
MQAVVIACPQCGSSRTYRDGLRYVDDSAIQRFLCRECGYRFSERHMVSKASKANIGERQVCAILQEAKNLSATESKTVAGEVPRRDAEGKLVQFLVKLKNEGVHQATITT